MKYVFSLLAVLALLAVPMKTVSANEDPDHAPWHLTTVSWIKANENNLDAEDRYAVLCGKVTKKIDSETYEFFDGTGTIQLDSEDKELPVGKAIVVRGKIDQDFSFFGKLEIDVRTWRHE